MTAPTQAECSDEAKIVRAAILDRHKAAEREVKLARQELADYVAAMRVEDFAGASLGQTAPGRLVLLTLAVRLAEAQAAAIGNVIVEVEAALGWKRGDYMRALGLAQT